VANIKEKFKKSKMKIKVHIEGMKVSNFTSSVKKRRKAASSSIKHVHCLHIAMRPTSVHISSEFRLST